jgi:hypothetical protein
MSEYILELQKKVFGHKMSSHCSIPCHELLCLLPNGANQGPCEDVKISDFLHIPVNSWIARHSLQIGSPRSFQKFSKWWEVPKFSFEMPELSEFDGLE